MSKYVIAEYILLSNEDGKLISLSIANQRLALNRYIDQMNDVSRVEVLEFIDNGLSGANFERPAV